MTRTMTIAIQVATFCAIVLVTTVRPAHADLISYEAGQWRPLLDDARGKPLIVHFWGFSCPPCVEELPAWAEFVRAHPALKSVFIEVDPAPPEMTRQTLADAGLLDADNRASSVYFDEYLRYEIDPQWFGELPVTLLIDAQGKVRKLRGTADFSAVSEWAKGVGH